MTGGRITAPLAVFILGSSAGCGGPYSTLDPAGPAASAAAFLWWGMFGLFTLVLVFVVGLWLYAMRRDPDPAGGQDVGRVHRRLLVGGGLVLPMASILVLLAFGIPAGHMMLPLPPAEGEALRIDVRAHQWYWETHYPGTGVRLVDEVHMPAGVPVNVHLTSEDVIHSFWVPRLAGKLDAIPGHENVLRLRAYSPGIYRGQCAEFCGVGHAHMQFTVHVYTPEDFEAWLEAAQHDD
ncbi:MAG: cytochrome c oxidase subunit II [Gammaproteobacteria bacterium]|nr:cytochrome c oxidase subunit II [Gammaproteobacteria bacterium]